MFLISEFSYFQLVCMYHSTTLINRIKNIQYRVLRIVCQDKKSTFKDLFQKGKAVSIHMKNATLDYRNLYSKKWYLFSFSFEKKNDIFELKSGIHLGSRNMGTQFSVTDTVFTLRSKIWELLPDEMKQASKPSKLKLNFGKTTTCCVGSAKCL